MIVIGLALHGICYDFFFVTGQIYTDNKAGEKVKSAAQGMITLATYGLGMLIGFKIAGIITDFFKNSNGTHDWVHIWLLPAAIAVVIVILFAILFKEKGQGTQVKPA